MIAGHLSVLCVALAIEVAVGYPPVLQRALGHPVQAAGWLIARLDRWCNPEAASGREGRLAGCAVMLILVAVAWLAGSGFGRLCAWALPPVPAVIARALVASTLFAQRSLYQHVRAVGVALDGGGLEAARRAVSHIVGRNPATLDSPGVLRAAIESLAENFSDAVVSPAVWCALFGLPGLFAFKMVNTADSMIGHRTPRYENFGWAAARLDDAANVPGARLSALLIAAAALPRGTAAVALRVALRDARRHRSPNAGWPEAAMAGALGLRLSGPRQYGAVPTQEPWVGDGRADLSSADLASALRLYGGGCFLLWLIATSLLVLV